MQCDGLRLGVNTISFFFPVSGLVFVNVSSDAAFSV